VPSVARWSLPSQLYWALPPTDRAALAFGRDCRIRRSRTSCDAVADPVAATVTVVTVSPTGFDRGEQDRAVAVDLGAEGAAERFA